MATTRVPTGEPGRTSKLKTLAEAVALIGDGSSIAVGGIHAHNGPLALVRELVRRGTSGLTIIPNVSVGLPAELLIAARAVDEIYASYVGLEHHGLAPAFRRQAEEGTLKVRDVDEAFLVYGMRAGAASLPFMPYPYGHEAVDVVRLNPDDYKTTTDPFTGEKVTVIPPLRADFGLLHVPQADPFGNVVIEGSVVQDILIAKSSMHVIVTAEEIVPVEETMKDPARTTIAGFFVDTVVHVPFGAHPASCHGRYQSDEDHIDVYQELGPDRYLDEYVRGTADQAEYLEKIGTERLVSLLERMVDRVG
jgi:glutaconate CoA-transferase, subunit A